MMDDTTVVFNGFLNLAAMEKMELVGAINEYFDSNDREPLRAAADERFARLTIGGSENPCKCCGR